MRIKYWLRSYFDNRYTYLPTILGFLVELIYILAPLTILAIGVENYPSLQMIVTAMAVIIGIVLVSYVYHIILGYLAQKRRPAKILAWAQQHDATYSIDGYSAYNASLLKRAEQKGLQLTNIYSTQHWAIADASFVIERKSRYGRYNGARVFQNVLALQLPRQVPNIFFDSKIYSARAFRWLLAGNQRDELEGHFYRYFRVYRPKDWHIDLRAIVTPDVMLALLDLKDCDIELSGNYVYLYSPLSFNPGKNLDYLLARGLKLQSELSHNLRSYRDDRLAGSAQSGLIHPSGSQLSKSRIRKIVGIIMLLLYIAVRIFAASLE